MNRQDAICASDLEPIDDDNSYIDGSCPECGAGPDEQCDANCGCHDDGEDEEDEELSW